MTETLDGLRVAIVHEWLVVPAGSEQVLREFVSLFPQADLFCLIDGLSDADRVDLGVGHPRTSFLQYLPGVDGYYRNLLPIMPRAIESLDLSAYDIVISNSHAVAKGVRTRPDAMHLCHCCSPMRYAWDLREQYLADAGLDHGVRGWLARQMLERLRKWDLHASARVSEFVAISRFIAERIERAYGRASLVVYPPVDVQFYSVDDTVERGDHYVAASRFVAYKKIPEIVAAFRELPDRRLVVIGDGPERERVVAAAGSNVELKGRLDREALRHELRRARAFIFAAEEDFGILPLEAQACGTPVIALGRGGALETVIDNGPARTGRFFADASAASIAEAVRDFERAPVPTAAACRRNAEAFSTPRFREEFLRVVTEAWARHRGRSATRIRLANVG